MGIKIFLYLSFFIIFYAYFGYALIALIIISIRKEKITISNKDFELKSLTLNIVLEFNGGKYADILLYLIILIYLKYD
jgi:hypothetical protein